MEIVQENKNKIETNTTTQTTQQQIQQTQQLESQTNE